VRLPTISLFHEGRRYCNIPSGAMTTPRQFSAGCLGSAPGLGNCRGDVHPIRSRVVVSTTPVINADCYSFFSSAESENAKEDAAMLNHKPVMRREGYLQWDEYFMALAFLSAQRSKDPSSQVKIGAFVSSRPKFWERFRSRARECSIAVRNRC